MGQKPLAAHPVDEALSDIFERALADSDMSLRELSRRSEVKLTRLGDILRRGRAMTAGEVERVSRALGLTPWMVVREAEARLSGEVDGGQVVPLLAAAPPPPPLSQVAARTVTHRPEWEAEKARREREASEQAEDGDGSRARS